MAVLVPDDDRARIAEPDIEKRRGNDLRAISGQCARGFLGKAIGADELYLFAASAGVHGARERSHFGLCAFKIVKP